MPVPLPEVDAGRYLLSALIKMGPVRPMPMGGWRAADWPEIYAFARSTGRIAEPWEADALYDMAQAYVVGLSEGENPLSIAPIDRHDPK